jgi:hypothetical protein
MSVHKKKRAGQRYQIFVGPKRTLGDGLWTENVGPQIFIGHFRLQKA